MGTRGSTCPPVAHCSVVPHPRGPHGTRPTWMCPSRLRCLHMWEAIALTHTLISDVRRGSGFSVMASTRKPFESKRTTPSRVTQSGSRTLGRRAMSRSLTSSSRSPRSSGIALTSSNAAADGHGCGAAGLSARPGTTPPPRLPRPCSGRSGGSGWPSRQGFLP